MGSPAERVNFTDGRVEAIKAPERGELCVWDTGVKGLCVRAVRGARTIYLYRRVNGKPTRLRIGSVGEVLVARAREVASAWNADLHAGRPLTPLANVAAPESRPSVRTLADVWADYMEREAKPNKRTWPEDQAKYDRFLKAHADTAFDAIDRKFIRARYEEVRGGKIPRKWRGGKAPAGWKQRPTPVQAARLVMLLSAVIEWEWDRREEEERYKGDRPNPCRRFLKMAKHKENKCETPLSESDFLAIVRAIDSHDATGGNRARCDALRLLVWTGLRKSNVTSMEWAWVKLDGDRPRVLIPADEFKGKREQLVPLIPQAVALLRRWRAAKPGSKYVLPGQSEDGHIGDLRPSWVKVLELAGFADRRPRIRMHDLRAHVATKLHRLGTPIKVIAGILGHKSILTTERYLRNSKDEHFDAMDRYGEAWGRVGLKLTEEEAA